MAAPGCKESAGGRRADGRGDDQTAKDLKENRVDRAIPRPGKCAITLDCTLHSQMVLWVRLRKKLTMGEYVLDRTSDRLEHLLCALILLSRLGDIVQHVLCHAESLELEANPVMRKLGWRFAIASILLCLHSLSLRGHWSTWS